MAENLTVEQRIENTLDKIRPFLQREGGDIRLDRFDAETGIAYVDMVGACAGCTMAATDVSDSVEVMVIEENPEVKKVELILPEKKEDDFEGLLRRLQMEQMAELEMRKMNAERQAEEAKKNSESDTDKEIDKKDE